MGPQQQSRVGEDTTLTISVVDVDGKLANDHIGTASIGSLVGRKAHQMLPMIANGGLQFTSIQLGPTDAANLQSIPERLHRGDIAGGIGTIRGLVTGCGDTHGGKGTVKVKIKIGPDGHVKRALGSGGTEALRGCVVDAVESATFRQTQLGMSVTYPFVFRSR